MNSIKISVKTADRNEPCNFHIPPKHSIKLMMRKHRADANDREREIPISIILLITFHEQHTRITRTSNKFILYARKQT